MNCIPAYIGTNLNKSIELGKELMNFGYNYYVYIIQCADQSYYTGVTNNLESRLWEHQNGINNKCYTYNKRPVQLKYSELYHIIQDAIAREKQLKGWSRKKKEALFKGDWDEIKKLAKSGLRQGQPDNPSTSSA